MTNLFNKLNEYFIHEPGEQVPLSDYVFFYTWIDFLITFLVITIILNMF